jgi:hypothetical protein
MRKSACAFCAACKQQGAETLPQDHDTDSAQLGELEHTSGSPSSNGFVSHKRAQSWGGKRLRDPTGS